ncbi:hypothetical protein AJ80_06678 [Polytolypa hystricis UAMH7299]|uniref:Vacuolar protein sorting-associated protein 62 n=1 Tax=Polytolypa hystricis (strain UAMH7299) TaxID=1447883 RepID=A0A2B7XVJ3_POLH7|nr:hypothetical protein AJ80_06678 [Polytolypa hystricis UAMH7299]
MATNFIEPIRTLPVRASDWPWGLAKSSRWLAGISNALALQPPVGHGGQVPLLPPIHPLPLVTFPHQPSVVSSVNRPPTHTNHAHGPRETLNEDPAPYFATVTSLPDSPLPEELLAQDVSSGTTIHVTHSGRTGTELESIESLQAVACARAELSLTQQMKCRTRAVITILSSLIAYVSINSLVRALNPEAFIWAEEDKEEPQWLATSNSWWDRKACRWLSLCGVSHYHRVRGHYGHRKSHQNDQVPIEDNDQSWRLTWMNGNSQPQDWSNDERRLREIPEYVLEYAPLVHLYPDENFWPCDIAEHLYHITPNLNYTPVESRRNHRSLNDLDKLNDWEHGRYVFLTSNDNVEDRPAWLGGDKNIPAPGDTDDGDQLEEWSRGVTGELPDGPSDDPKSWHNKRSSGPLPRDGNLPQLDNDRPSGPMDKPHEEYDGGHLPESQFGSDGNRPLAHKGGRSDAPAVLIVVDKGDGIVDAFWFYFYSFNLGNMVFNIRFGNHVGDWEHSLVRFHNGTPKTVYFSEHSGGEAYSYKAVEKIGKRPVIYSATGTHAMYATPGTHSYILPWGLLHDRTDRGPLWDPALNSHVYTYDYKNDTLRASTVTPQAPTEWFYFAGHWGDKFYPLGDERQYRFAGQYHYVNGPLGPRFKNLGRQDACQSDETPCVIKNWIGEDRRVKRWAPVGEGEQISQQDINRFFGNTSLAAPSVDD